MADWNELHRKNRGAKPSTDGGTSTIDNSRKLRAEVYGKELERLRAQGNSPWFNTGVAAQEADRAVRAAGLPDIKQYEDARDSGAVAKDLSTYGRIMTSGVGQGSRAFYKGGEKLGLWNADDPNRFSYYMKAAGDAASAKSSGLAEDLASGMVSLASDPVWLSTYALTRGRLGNMGGQGSRPGFGLIDDVIGGLVADTASSGLRNDFDLGSGMKTEIGMGAGGAVAGDLLLRGIGKAWRHFFPDEALPKTAAEATRILDERQPDWKAQAETIDRLGETLQEVKDVAGAEVRAREIIPNNEVGNKLELPPQREVPTGLERFEARQKARDIKLQADLDRPHMQARKELDAPIKRLETENLGGRVLDDPINDFDPRAEALKDPDVVDEIAQLESMGMSREEAESLAIPDLPRTPGSAKMRGTTTILPDIVNAGIKSGQWAIQHTMSAARWVLDTAGDSIQSMRDFANVLIEKFGRGIRKFVPESWQRFKVLQQRRATIKIADPILTEQRNFQQDKLAFRASKRLKGVKAGIDYLIDPIADRLHKISPRLTTRLYRYMTESNITKHELRKVMDPIMNDKAVKALPDDVRNRVKSSLLNANPDEFGKIAKAIGGDGEAKLNEMYTEARRILDDLFNEAEAVGMQPEYLENFWPRSIKPGKTALLRERLSGSQKSAFDDALKDLALRKYGGDVASIPGDEVASVVNKVIAGYGPRPLDSSLPKPLKHRRVTQIPDELLQYYESFNKSLDAYIERMSNEIAKRRLLGGSKDIALNTDDLLNDSIGKLIADEGITGAKADEVSSMIQSLIRGSESSVGTAVRLMRDAGYILTMGQVRSALRQFGDFFTAGQQFGFVNTMKGVYRTALGENQVSLLDLGLDRMAEEYASARSSKAVDFVFKMTGLDFLDRKVIKNAAIDAALLKAQKEARANPDRLLKKLTMEFGDSAEQLVKDLANGEISDDLLVYLTARLGDIQPITRMEVPQGYLDARDSFKGSLRGSPVLVYQLKTFTLRRLGLMRRKGLHEIARGLTMMKQGQRQEGAAVFLNGAKSLAAMTAVFATGDTAVDQAINWIYGEDDTVGESLADSMWQMIGTNRYGVDQVKRGGAPGFTAVVAPPAGTTLMQLLTDAINLLEGKTPKTLRRIPHMQTLEIFSGKEDERPKRPQRPERPAR